MCIDYIFNILIFINKSFYPQNTNNIHNIQENNIPINKYKDIIQQHQIHDCNNRDSPPPYIDVVNNKTLINK